LGNIVRSLRTGRITEINGSIAFLTVLVQFDAGHCASTRVLELVIV
jgi:hypothetical protein